MIFLVFEIQVVILWKVVCDGDESCGLGYLCVWLVILQIMGEVDCGYCDKCFVIDCDYVYDDY